MCPQESPHETPAVSADFSRLKRRQAEKVAGVSRATLARYVSDGKLSAKKDDQGNNVYDAAELARVFPDTFNLKQLETPASKDGVSQTETGDTPRRDSTELAVLQVEKRYLTEERDRLQREAERLQRELVEERGKREAERTGFMDMLRQNQETVKQLTDQREKVEQELRVAQTPVSPPAPPRPRGFLDWLLNRTPQ